MTTTTKQNVSENTGDGKWMIKDYSQKIQYRTFRNGLTTATVRFDDDCGNGHCAFSITGEYGKKNRYGDPEECGCIHDRIAIAFPDLAPLLKWHLTSTDGPMHYIANTIHLAGNRDCWGRVAGEASAFEHGVRFAGVPVTHKMQTKFWQFCKERMGAGDFQVVAIAYEPREGESYDFKPKWTFVGFGEKWHDCPFDSEVEAREMAEALNTVPVEFVQIAVEFSNGKARELDAARRVAVWPEATDAELSVGKEELKAALEARLPALLAEFRRDVESLGFDYEFPTKR